MVNTTFVLLVFMRPISPFQSRALSETDTGVNSLGGILSAIFNYDGEIMMVRCTPLSLSAFASIDKLTRECDFTRVPNKNALRSSSFNNSFHASKGGLLLLSSFTIPVDEENTRLNLDLLPHLVTSAINIRVSYFDLLSTASFLFVPWLLFGKQQAQQHRSSLTYKL